MTTKEESKMWRGAVSRSLSLTSAPQNINRMRRPARKAPAKPGRAGMATQLWDSAVCYLSCWRRGFRRRHGAGEGDHSCSRRGAGPLAPAALEGLANLRGKVLPIISLRRLFGFAELEHDDSTRALVVDVGQPLGFVVDRVSSVMGVDAGHIEDVGSISSTVNTDVLERPHQGCRRPRDDHGAGLCQAHRAGVLADCGDHKKHLGGGRGPGPGAKRGRGLSDELQLVSFNVEGQEYAIAIEDVQEIVQVPEAVIHVPHWSRMCWA